MYELGFVVFLLLLLITITLFMLFTIILSGSKLKMGCTRFLTVPCYWSRWSHSPECACWLDWGDAGILWDCDWINEIPFPLSCLPKKSLFSGLLIWIYLWKGLTSAGIWCLRIGQCSWRKLADKTCLAVTNQPSCLWSHSPAVNWSSWGTGRFACPDLAEVGKAFEAVVT